MVGPVSYNCQATLISGSLSDFLSLSLSWNHTRRATPRDHKANRNFRSLENAQPLLFVVFDFGTHVLCPLQRMRWTKRKKLRKLGKIPWEKQLLFSGKTLEKFGKLFQTAYKIRMLRFILDYRNFSQNRISFFLLNHSLCLEIKNPVTSHAAKRFVTLALDSNRPLNKTNRNFVTLMHTGSVALACFRLKMDWSFLKEI